MTINELTDIVLLESTMKSYKISPLKLQKLMYYIQAWYLAFMKKPLLDMKFQAWVHGPVNKAVFDRFKANYGMYDTIDENIESIPDCISEETLSHIRNVLETYLPYTDTQLESLTHNEAPWITARDGLPPYKSSETIIDEKIMMEFYSSLLSK